MCVSASVSSSAHQTFLITQRQVHTLDQMSEEWEVDYQVTLSQSLYWLVLYAVHHVSQVDLCERSVWWPGPLWGIAF